MSQKLILRTLAGSHLYGTNTPESDVDYRGILIQSVEDLMNPFSRFEQEIRMDDEDSTNWAMDKFFKLAADCNPNIIEILYANDESIQDITKGGLELVNNAGTFLSQKIKNTFVGYAMSQMKRIETHRGYLLNPPKKKPERSNYGLPESPYFGLEKITNVIWSPKEVIKDEWREYAEKERSYRDASDNWTKYMSWKKGRNPKRAVSEEKYGFDLKHGCHLMRLLLEGQDLLYYENLEFPLDYKDFLLEIRNGYYSYERLLEMAKDEKDKLDKIETKLPKVADKEKLLDLYFRIYEIEERTNE